MISGLICCQRYVKFKEASQLSYARLSKHEEPANSFTTKLCDSNANLEERI